MIRHLRNLTLAFAALGLLGLGSILLGAQEPKAGAPPAAGDFTGKMIIVSYGHGDKFGSVVLDKPKVKKLGDRSFVTGIGVDEWTEDRWAHGTTAWVPVDTVMSIYEVATDRKSVV